MKDIDLEKHLIPETMSSPILRVRVGVPMKEGTYGRRVALLSAARAGRLGENQIPWLDNEMNFKRLVLGCTDAKFCK